MKNNDDEIKLRYKKLKENNSHIYKRFEILNHAMNKEITDSIIMQIVSNFSTQSGKVKRPFDLIFSKDLKYIGISLIGTKKFTGNIIFAA